MSRPFYHCLRWAVSDSGPLPPCIGAAHSAVNILIVVVEKIVSLGTGGDTHTHAHVHSDTLTIVFS